MEGEIRGRRANRLKEKNVVLDLARMIQKIIQTKAPSITVYLMRDGDYFLPHENRADIAEEYNADLFISLHVNANPSREYRGFQYIRSLNATDAAARELAEKENARIYLEVLKPQRPQMTILC